MNAISLKLNYIKRKLIMSLMPDESSSQRIFSGMEILEPYDLPIPPEDCFQKISKESFSFETKVFRRFLKEINNLNETVLLMFSNNLLGAQTTNIDEEHYHDIMRRLNLLLLELAKNLKNIKPSMDKKSNDILV
jgi:hypothetical protein